VGFPEAWGQGTKRRHPRFEMLASMRRATSGDLELYTGEAMIVTGNRIRRSAPLSALLASSRARPPGARATWDFSTPVTFAGAGLDAGRYGVWHVPHESEPWEIVLVSEWDTHHSFFPFENEAARVRVTPETGAHMETLAFYFPVVGEYDAVLRLHWGSTIIPLRIEVPR